MAFLRLLVSRWVLSLFGTALLAGLVWVFGPLLPALEADTLLPNKAARIRGSAKRSLSWAGSERSQSECAQRFRTCASPWP